MIDSNSIHARDFLLRAAQDSAHGKRDMTTFFTMANLKQVWNSIWPFLVVGAVGVALAYFSAGVRGRELADRLADALMIGSVVGICLELAAASILIDHAAEALSSKLVGYGLPPAAQELVHALVHKTKLVYLDYQTTYRIEPLSGDKVRVHVKTRYTVVNYGSSSESYKPRLDEDGQYFSNLISLEYGGKKFVPDGIRDLQTGVVFFRPEFVVQLSPSRAAAAISTLNENQLCKVFWSYSLEMPERYSDVVAFTGVTVDPEINVELPSGFEFHASQGEENRCLHAEGGLTWNYKRAFVAGQHLRVWWRPKDK